MSLFAGLGSLMSRLLHQSDVPLDDDSPALDALAILISVASADGLLHAGERDLLQAVAGQGNLAAERFAGLIEQARATDVDDAAARLRRLWPLPDRTALMDRAIAMAKADGEIGEIEQATIERLARLLDVDVRIPFPGVGGL